MLTSTTATVIKLVPLESLALSPENAATVGRDDVADLVASIRAIGLQQNLVVKEDGEAEGTRYLVKAGGRRLRALQQLAEAGEWSDPVPVNLLSADANTVEISLAENIQRRDMHPADEFQAFRTLIDADGLSIDDVAARFGRTERYVEGRLRLANVSPKILERFKQDELTIAQVMALAVTDDHAAQEKVWEAASRANNDYHQRPDRLRAELMEKELEVGEDDIATYLGAKDYEAGGGQARHDLFSELVWLPDAKLARRLAKEKLDKAAKKVRAEGWSWVEVRLELDYFEANKFARPLGYPGQGAAKWDAEAKKIGGAILHIENGKMTVARGLVRPADLKQAAATSKSKSVQRAAERVKPARKPGQLSWAQAQLLHAERDTVLRDELASNPRITLAALAASLADNLQIISGTALDEVIRVSRGHLTSDRIPIVARPIEEKHAAAKRLREKAAAWKGRVPKGSSTLEWLLTQPESTTHELLTLCAAMALHAMPWSEGRQDAGAKLAQIAGLDMASHWAPGTEWLERQPTSYITEAVQQARGKVAAAELRKAKGKKAVVKKAAELLAAGPGRPAWLPAPLRAPAVKAKAKLPRKAGKAAAAGD